MKPRLLPAVIGVTALLLAFKAAELGNALLPRGMSAAMMPKAEASPSHEAAPAHGAAAPAGAEAAKPGARPPAPPVPPPPPAAIGPIAEPPVSDAERKLLTDLRARRTELDARDRVLAERQAVLDAAEQRLASRVTQLAALQSRLEQMDRDRQGREEANWTGLVKTYETMRPRDAAAIFNEMEMPVLLQVVDRMKDAKAAAVLAAMLPDRARLLTTQLAAQRTRNTTVPEAPGAAG